MAEEKKTTKSTDEFPNTALPSCDMTVVLSLGYGPRW